jgi:hypothetical protein
VSPDASSSRRPTSSSSSGGSELSSSAIPSEIHRSRVGCAAGGPPRAGRTTAGGGAPGAGRVVGRAPRRRAHGRPAAAVLEQGGGP